MNPQTVESPVKPAEQIPFDFFPQIPVVVQPSAGALTSDAGLLPIRQFDQRWDYTQRMAACLLDPKPQREQSLLSMLRQRLFGILAGYEDCNDHDTLRDDPVFKLIADRLPDGEALASQPTLSRFENLATPQVLQKLIDFTIATGIERLKQHHGGQLPASLTLDLDATDDPTHGHQQLTLFHGYYGQYQYFPLIISEPTTKHVFVAWLRPGTVHASIGADDDLLRVVAALRKERPDILIHVRGDAGFGLPRMYEVCEENRLTYTFGFATNARLKKRTEELMTKAVEGYAQTKEKQRLFECFAYQCDSWDHPRKVITKAECHDQGTNLCFVVTNRPGVTGAADGQREYDDYMPARRERAAHGRTQERPAHGPPLLPSLHGQLLPSAPAHRRHEPAQRPARRSAVAGGVAQGPALHLAHAGDQSRRRDRAEHPPRAGQTRRPVALVGHVSGPSPSVPAASSRRPDPLTTRFGQWG